MRANSVPQVTVTCISTVAVREGAIAPVRFDYPERQITVRELITLAVREQCALLSQQHISEDAQARLAGQFLSAAEIGAQAARGAVNAAGPARRAPPLDHESEIAKALAGFEAGAFLVLVGSLRCSALDQTITLDLAQPVQFVRMIALTGG